MRNILITPSSLLRAIGLLGAVAEACRAQSGVVLPSVLGAQEGARIAGEPFSSELGRWQWVIDRSLLQELGTPWSVRELWFRRDMTSVRTLAGGTLDVEVLASETLAAPDHPSPVFADNRGAQHALRFQQRLDFPASLGSTSIPAAWDVATAAAVRFVFEPPLLAQGSGNLCLEVVTREVAGRNSPDFVVDGAYALGGSSTPFGASCAVAGFLPRATARDELLLPGCVAMLRLADAPVGRLAVNLLGFSNQSIGVIPLPLPLDSVGAPGCALYNDWVHLQASLTSRPRPDWAAGEAQCAVPLPMDPALLGGTFFTQWLLFDPAANALGIAATHGLQCRVAGSLSLPSFGITAVASKDTQALTGRVLKHLVPVLRLLP